MAAHDGFGLVDDAPAENKKGARCQPLLVGLGNLNLEAVLRPCRPARKTQAGRQGLTTFIPRLNNLLRGSQVYK